MKLYVLARAKRRVRVVDAWWREHRPAAPDLFIEELAAACALLVDAPRIGPVYRQAGKHTIRRYLLRKTQQHVFYRVDEQRDTLTLVTVWGAARGRPPVLR